MELTEHLNIHSRNNCLMCVALKCSAKRCLNVGLHPDGIYYILPSGTNVVGWHNAELEVEDVDVGMWACPTAHTSRVRVFLSLLRSACRSF